MKMGSTITISGSSSGTTSTSTSMGLGQGQGDIHFNFNLNSSNRYSTNKTRAMLTNMGLHQHVRVHGFRAAATSHQVGVRLPPSSNNHGVVPKFSIPIPMPALFCKAKSHDSAAAAADDDHSQPPPPTAVAFVDQPPVFSRIWTWKGYSIRYQCCGHTGPPLLLIHGFGANSDHWRKNLPVLGMSHRVYSIDLLGYGYSDKPNPRDDDFGLTSFYTFETWASQINDFCLQVVKDDAFFICNSIGGLVGLQAAVMEPQICKGLVLLNISLRMLHIKKQPPFSRPFIKGFQSLLRNTGLGKLFFRAVATPQSVRNILCQCYHDTSQVTEELVDKILLPGLEPGAADVFLEFICYSDGPLPEELLPQVKCPVLVVWGDKDPWEPIELGRAYGNFESVEDFIVLPGVGHCPQDEAPHLVNPLVQSFVERHSTARNEVSSG